MDASGQTNTYTVNELNQYERVAQTGTAAPRFAGTLFLLDRRGAPAGVTPAVVSLRYDADGNLLSDGVWHYAWDAENRLIEVSNASTRVTCVYDHLGRRMAKQVFCASPTGSWLLTTGSCFLYDGWNLIREVRSQGTVFSTNDYVWGLDISGMLHGAAGVGGLIFLLTPDSCPLTPVFDGSGNLIALADSSNPTNLLARYEYGPFGEVISATGPAAEGNPWRFSTRYTDRETGLVMYPKRPYLPALGRWLSRDLLEEDGGVNLYGAFDNNPGHLADPLGLVNIVVSGTDGTRVWTKGQDATTPVTDYLDYAGRYYFGEGNFESRGSFVTPLSFGRKWWSLPVAFIADAIRVRPATFSNLIHNNAYLQDVAINAARVAELIESSSDELDIIMGHSQGVTLAAAGVAMAATGHPVQESKTVRLILMAPKIGFDVLERYLEDAKRSQPCWSIDVLVIGNLYDNAIPCGTRAGYVAHYDPLRKPVHAKGERAQRRWVPREGTHYGLGFPLGRKSRHWKTLEIHDKTNPHDSYKHVGLVAEQGDVRERRGEQYEQIRSRIRAFISAP